MTGHGVEVAAAGDKPERGVISRGVDNIRRVFVFVVFPNASHAEDGRDSVGQRHIDMITGTQCAEPEKDCRSPVTIHVAFDDRRPDLPGRHRVFVPGGVIGARNEVRYLDRAILVEPEVEQVRLDAYFWDGDRNRQRLVQRRPPRASSPDVPRGRRRRSRCVLLREYRYEDGHGAAEDEADTREPR